MNKQNKLFAILFAVLGVGTLSAQTDVTSQYLTNADFETSPIDFTVANNGSVSSSSVRIGTTGWVYTIPGWTNACVINNNAVQVATAEYGLSTSQTNGLNSTIPPASDNNSNTGAALHMSAGWGDDAIVTQASKVDLQPGVYEFTYAVCNQYTNTNIAVNFTGATLANGTTATGKLNIAPKGTWVSETISFVVTTAQSATFKLGFTTSTSGSGDGAKLYVDNLKLTYKAFTNVTEANPVDLTSMATNTWVNGGNTYTAGGIVMRERYFEDQYRTGDMMTQKISGLPAGIYKVELYANANWTSNRGNIKTAAAEAGAEVSSVFANDITVKVPLAHQTSTATAGVYTLNNVKVTDGTLNLGLRNDSEGANWLLVAVKSITFLGPDKTLEETGFNNNVTALKALDKEGVPNAFVSQIDGIITTYGNAEASTMTLSELMDANAEIKALIDAYNVLAEPYANLQSLIATCENINTNSVEAEAGAKDVFVDAITAATTNAENATTADAINEQYNTLEAARKVYVEKADPTNDTYFDYTYKIKNAAVASGDNWTGSRVNSGEQYTGAPDNTYFDSWNGSGQDIYQELTGLPSGLYTLTAAGRASTSCTSAYIYLNDAKAEIDKAGNSGNELGNGWKWFTTEKTSVAGTAKIGFKANTANSQWAGADDFKLYYYGFDVTSAQTSVSSLVAEAKELAAKPMNTGVLAELNDAISGADATKTTRLELNPMIEALDVAITAANASIAEYEKLNRYISMTEVFTDVTAYQQKYNNGQFTTDEVEAVRQELNIKRYNAASTMFTNKVEVTGWTGDLANGVRSDQHWSGETKSYYDANSWTDNYVDLKHTLSTTVTLPEGTYVLKAAGRSDSDVTLTLNIKDGNNVLESVEYTGKGDKGYGIDTDGNANFSEEATYADVKDGNGNVTQANGGRGWEWEFAKFELNAETTVTLHVEVDYNSIRNRFGSFSDITLWMDDETYINVNGHAIDAPLAAAKALVNTKPMGTDENTALVNAIAQGEGTISTPAQLDGAVAALNTAVANANAWVAAYNEAKAPLVAALERFEADFNLEGDADHAYMRNGLWADVLDKVQAAAVAKDATDSYEGFANATENLNTALDAAQASINMYANLAAEISYAKAYTPVVAENADGHTAAIEVAQAAYDAAEIDDASALILGMQNYRALDYIHITENYTEEVKLGKWTGKTNSNKGEHWSGDGEKTYFDYSKWASGHTNGANEATQTITLPAGKYVLMAAGRAANVTGTEAYIKVNDTKVNFAAKGSYGYGIATDGTANFATEGTYGRDNEGYGWEYRFITFTLTEESEVTLTAGMTIDVNTADLSWAGVCAPVLYKQGATQVNLAISAVEWATLILPFDAELPDGVKAYSCGEVDGDALVLEEAANFVANTPYLVNGAEGTYSFEGYSIAEEDSYTVGLFTGTYVDYQTTANSNTYVLQKNNNGEAAFYLVGEEAQPWVRAYHCYMTYEGAAGAPMFSISRGEDTTGIENATLNAQPSIVIYDLMGRKVTTMVKGGMYIVNGKKVIVK